MSKLPDIDPDSTGLIAFWNAIDQSTEDSIDPSEVTSDGNVQSQTLYDNGVEGEYQLKNARGNTATYRVKTDGWFVVYLDSESDDVYGKDNNSVTGQFDIVEDWGVNSDPQSGRNNLEIAINNLASELSNWATISNYYNSSDVGLYSFDWENASGVTILSRSQQGYQTTTMDLTPTTGTDVKYFTTFGYVESSTNQGFSYSFEGNTVFDAGSYQNRAGAREMLSLLGGSLTAGQQYSATINEGASHSHYVSCCALLIWE
jgi:hypothetical protein